MSKAQHWKGQKWTLPIPQTGHDGQPGECCPRRCRLGNREAFSAAGIKEAARALGPNYKVFWALRSASGRSMSRASGPGDKPPAVTQSEA